MRLLSVVLVAGVAISCKADPRPPRGPDHTPTDSPEAESSCPTQWKTAKDVRELLLGDDSAAARAKKAAAVLAQADCERQVLARGSFAPATHQGLLAEVAQVRSDKQNTDNLYNEVDGYGVPLPRVAAIVGRGQLATTFAARLAAMPMPTDVTDEGERAAFRSEVASLVDYFEREAEREYRDGLGAAEAVPGADPHVAVACDGLVTLGLPAPNSCPPR